MPHPTLPAAKEMPNRQCNHFEILDKKSHINNYYGNIVIGFNNFSFIRNGAHMLLLYDRMACANPFQSSQNVYVSDESVFVYVCVCMITWLCLRVCVFRSKTG